MKNTIYFMIGLLVLALNKVRYVLAGYRRPKPFQDPKQDIIYDQKVVSGWRQALEDYAKQAKPFAGKTILELGPGSDIGTGALLLDQGAKSYQAFDKNNLVKNTPPAFYQKLAKQLKTKRAGQELKNFQTGASEKLSFTADKHFDLAALPDHYDLIVSQAAFEHFGNPEHALKQLSAKAIKGAILCAEIDLQTHSRGLRQRDPNNIYRFPAWLYWLLSFPGQPNRFRPEQYRKMLAENGWHKIKIIPLQTAQETDSLDPTFDRYDMRLLSCLLLASKK